MMRKLPLLLPGLILLLVLACQPEIDNPIVPTNECRLTRMVQGLHGGGTNDSVFSFFYSSNGQIEKIKDEYLGSNFEFWFRYDNSGRLVKVELDANDNALASDFSYNAQGRLKEISERGPGSSKIVFEYTTDTVPSSAKEYYNENGQWTLRSERKYTYNNGNLVKVEITDQINGSYAWNYEYYDTIPNRLGNLALASFYSMTLGYYDESYLFSRKMLKRSGDGHFITYKIDSGRTVSSVDNYLSNGGSDTFHRASRFFEYECR